MRAKGLPIWMVLLLVMISASVRLGVAQERILPREVRPVASSVESALQQMTQASAVIFAGEVVAVARPTGFAGSAQDAAEGFVTIRFRVDDAVRGCTGGSIYTLREWAGLWTGSDRYRVGQRLLLFLRGAGNGGSASPVGGKAGIVPLRGSGQAPGPYDSSTGTAEWLADLRWVRMQNVPAGDGTRAAGSIPAEAANLHGTPAVVPDPYPVPTGNFARGVALIPSAEPATRPLSQVLSLCRDWAGGNSAGNDKAGKSNGSL